ncbi:flagellar basal-body protein FlbY [Alkalicaulis satelles]|uniref:Flagellar basal-body protein FlbY n=1 Tax=Alkalicaulis satelles TaxID=2609175 RepID=A0A5M6ZF30_9PROT|nr:flagellar basal-body protein FlbY [Alkalicaulis satelles]KAA5803353.1 flagellar basal-body protein FlbY [Alkalicaulis satelles]
MSELAATTPDGRAAELIRLTERLIALLEQETGLFEARRPHEAVTIQTEKMRLATLYRAETQRAAREPERLTGITPALKAKLQEATERFNTALARNHAAVEALKVLTEGLVRAIAEEAARQKQAQAGYGPSAAKYGAVGALACNQTA